MERSDLEKEITKSDFGPKAIKLSLKGFWEAIGNSPMGIFTGMFPVPRCGVMDLGGRVKLNNGNFVDLPSADQAPPIGSKVIVYTTKLK